MLLKMYAVFKAELPLSQHVSPPCKLCNSQMWTGLISGILILMYVHVATFTEQLLVPTLCDSNILASYMYLDLFMFINFLHWNSLTSSLYERTLLGYMGCPCVIIVHMHCSQYCKCHSHKQCTKKHVLDCPEFLSGCRCPRGNACPLRHPNRVVNNVSNVTSWCPSIT